MFNFVYTIWEILAKAQRFVDIIVLVFVLDWSKRLSNFENVVQTPFQLDPRTSNGGRFCQTVYDFQGKIAPKFSKTESVIRHVSGDHLAFTSLALALRIIAQ